MLTGADQRAFAEAGFVGKAGTLTHALDLGTLLVPTTLDLDEEQQHLRWRWDYDNDNCGHEMRPDWQMFDEFIALGDAGAVAIRDYARRYGPLDICEHGEPRGHNQHNGYPLLWGIEHGELMRGVEPGQCQPLYDERDPMWLWEPVERWRHYAREALAILRVAERTLRQREADDAEWKWLTGSLPPSIRERRDFFAQRLILSSRIGLWLQLGGVKPTLTWPASGPALEWQPCGLFGVLAMQLAATVSRTGGFAYCDGCGIRFTPNQLPTGDKRVFCDDCRKHGVPQALAAKDYRRSKKAKARVAKSEPTVDTDHAGASLPAR